MWPFPAVRPSLPRTARWELLTFKRAPDPAASQEHPPVSAVGAEAVLHCPQASVTGETVTLEGEHGINQMPSTFGAGQHALLGDMAHQQQAVPGALPGAARRRRQSRTLGHRAGPLLSSAFVERLTAVDDRHGRRRARAPGEPASRVGFSQELEVDRLPRRRRTSPSPAQLHLLGRLFGSHTPPSTNCAIT